MATPGQDLTKWVEGLQEGKVPPETFLEYLSHFEDHVVSFQEHLDSMVIPPELPEGEAYLEVAHSCFSNYFEAIDLLREFIETGNTELLPNVRRLTEEADGALQAIANETKEQAARSVSVDSLGA